MQIVVIDKSITETQSKQIEVYFYFTKRKLIKKKKIPKSQSFLSASNLTKIFFVFFFNFRFFPNSKIVFFFFYAHYKYDFSRNIASGTNSNNNGRQRANRRQKKFRPCECNLDFLSFFVDFRLKKIFFVRISIEKNFQSIEV